MLASGLPAGDLLELGPGPGYVGLELAKKLHPHTLTGCDISPAMLQIAQNNAAAYGIAAQYVLGTVLALPFEDESFDGVFSNGSLHEWERPVKAFDEIYRVLRPGGRYCITDLRRDAGTLRTALVYHSTKPKAMADRDGQKHHTGDVTCRGHMQQRREVQERDERNADEQKTPKIRPLRQPLPLCQQNH